jgi:Phospholipid methyltransferase
MNQVESPEPAAPKADTSGVRVPPPSYHVAGFLAGVALELVSPTPWPAAGIRIAVAVLAVGARLALDGAATLNFRRAGTSMVPMNPTTALVTSGPYRLTRNPIYLAEDRLVRSPIAAARPRAAVRWRAAMPPGYSWTPTLPTGV